MLKVNQYSPIRVTKLSTTGLLFLTLVSFYPSVSNAGFIVNICKATMEITVDLFTSRTPPKGTTIYDQEVNRPADYEPVLSPAMEQLLSSKELVTAKDVENVPLEEMAEAELYLFKKKKNTMAVPDAYLHNMKPYDPESRPFAALANVCEKTLQRVDSGFRGYRGNLEDVEVIILGSTNQSLYI